MNKQRQPLTVDEAFDAALDEAMNDDWVRFSSSGSNKRVLIELKDGGFRQYDFVSEEAHDEFLEYLLK